MAFDFDVLAWEHIDGDRYEGKPDDVSIVHGELVHAYNPSTGEHDYFWAFNLEGTYDNWEDWLDLIESLCEMYGLELA